MKYYFITIVPLVLSTAAIKISVEKSQVNKNEIEVPKIDLSTENINEGDIKNDPAAYQSIDEGLIAEIQIPSTYLTPPSADQSADGFLTDWSKYFNIPDHNKTPHQRKVPYYKTNTLTNLRPNAIVDQETLVKNIIKPSIQLQPPFENEFVTPETKLGSIEDGLIQSSDNFQGQPENKNNDFKPAASNNVPLNFKVSPTRHRIPMNLVPPKVVTLRYPTMLYPKKFNHRYFRPIPIPVNQFAPGGIGVPNARPLNHFMPGANNQHNYYPFYEQQKVKDAIPFNDEEDFILQQQKILDAAVEQTYGNLNNEDDVDQSTQTEKESDDYNETTSSNEAELDNEDHPAPNERTEFRMHGLKGPHSYQFGYDTGKGKNRQFRFEERDNDGRVIGHYGYTDNDGKVRVVNYKADPETGFQAEAPK